MMSARTLARAALPLLIVVAAVVSSLQLEHIEDSRQAARMRVRTDDAVRQIRSRIGDYTDVLYGIRGLYQASSTVHGREFAAQVRGADVAARCAASASPTPRPADRPARRAPGPQPLGAGAGRRCLAGRAPHRAPGRRDRAAGGHRPDHDGA